MLPIDILKLEANQPFLSLTDEFANGTPSNRIIFKTLPGIGATHGEILLYTSRNSIIIEPNVPVLTGKRDAIEDKKKLYPDILIVYKKVNRKAVEDYLKSDISPKKILCTPEAYKSKVKPAIEATSFDLYNDFFMLLDECDRLIKDVDFRDKIILPIRDFFKFKEKAMISATAIEPSDKRFAENGFRILKVEPQFEYAKPLNLISTNNVMASLCKVLKQEKGQINFIFVNSTNLIHSIIKSLKIEDESRVFCAHKSVKKLQREGFTNASENLGEFGKYNFLTSRFFSAVDIKLFEQKPNVIMLTDLYQAQFTMLDPYTDSVQIVGRLRNGVNKVIHITNHDPNLSTFDEEILLKNINDSYQEYSSIKNKSTAQTEAALETLKQALDGTDISLLIDDEGELNSFMIDNTIHENKIKKLYKNLDVLENGYEQVKNFKLKTIELKFNITDVHLHAYAKQENFCKRCETVAEILHIYDNPVDENGEMRFYLGDDKDLVRNENPEIATYYDRIGYDKMKSLGFYESKIKRYISQLDKKDELDNPKIKKEIQALYTPPVTVSEDKIKKDCQQIFTRYRVKKKFAASDIERYYKARRTSDNLGFKCWKLSGLK